MNIDKTQVNYKTRKTYQKYCTVTMFGVLKGLDINKSQRTNLKV